MYMQQLEQPKPFGQEWQASQEYSGYRADYPGRYEQEQQQKIYPQEERSLGAIVLGILAIIFSSIAFSFAVVGIVGSAIVLKYANGQTVVLTGGGLGLASSIIVLLVSVASFVITVVALARPHVFRGRGTRVGRYFVRDKR